MAEEVSPTTLVLASASPRRRELLSLLPFFFQVVEPQLDEASLAKQFPDPEEQARHLALAKAEDVAGRVPDKPIIAADTIVVLLSGGMEGQVLGKPKDAQEATKMLHRLRGKEHLIITGLAVVNRALGKTLVDHTVTRGWARHYSPGEIAAYVATGDPMNKAGACDIQHPVFRPVSLIQGCYCNCIGLPLCNLLSLLKAAGFPEAPDPPAGPELCPYCQRMIEFAPYSPNQTSN